MSEHERFLEETRFVLIAEGDGAEIRIANAGDIHDELHRLAHRYFYDVRYLLRMIVEIREIKKKGAK